LLAVDLEGHPVLPAQAEPGSLDGTHGSAAELNSAATRLGCKLDAPFMTLSFLSLSPIPELKLTDQGLIDAVKMRATDLFVE